jgi:hypothetical protein
MNMPEMLDDKALELLITHGYVWDPALYAFRRARRVRDESVKQYQDREPILVTFEELDDHSLTGLRGEHAIKALTDRWFEKVTTGRKWLAESLHSKKSNSN